MFRHRRVFILKDVFAYEIHCLSLLWPDDSRTQYIVYTSSGIYLYNVIVLRTITTLWSENTPFRCSANITNSLTLFFMSVVVFNCWMAFDGTTFFRFYRLILYIFYCSNERKSGMEIWKKCIDTIFADVVSLLLSRQDFFLSLWKWH